MLFEQQDNKQKLQILEALHIRSMQPKLYKINCETSANVLKCLQLLTLFIETNLKSKRYTIQQYKRSFLQSSNVHTKVTSPDDGPKLGRKYLGNN